MEIKSEPIVISRKALEIIEYLDVPDERRWLDVTQFQANACAALEKKGLIETAVDGKLRVAMLTETGRDSRFDVIVEGSREHTQYLTSRNKHTDSVAVSENGGGIETCNDTCESCIHRDVLNLIAAKYPKIAALRDSMLEQRRILKELGL